jgi:hypothetical protein
VSDEKSEREALVKRLTKRAMNALRVQLAGQPITNAPWETDSWVATGGEVNVELIVRGCLEELDAYMIERDAAASRQTQEEE